MRNRRIPFHACGTPFVPPALEDGDHEFAVRAIDDAGNIDPTPVTSEFVVDTRVTGAETKLLSRRIDRRERSLGPLSVEDGGSPVRSA